MRRHSRALQVEGLAGALRQLVPAYQFVRGTLLFVQQLRLREAQLRSQNAFGHTEAVATSHRVRVSNRTNLAAEALRSRLLWNGSCSEWISGETPSRNIADEHSFVLSFS